jgi:hypothetical protein
MLCTLCVLKPPSPQEKLRAQQAEEPAGVEELFDADFNLYTRHSTAAAAARAQAQQQQLQQQQAAQQHGGISIAPPLPPADPVALAAAQEQYAGVRLALEGGLAELLGWYSLQPREDGQEEVSVDDLFMEEGVEERARGAALAAQHGLVQQLLVMDGGFEAPPEYTVRRGPECEGAKGRGRGWGRGCLGEGQEGVCGCCPALV